MQAEKVILAPGSFTVTQHRNKEDYAKVAQLLGIDLKFSEADARAKYPGATWGPDLKLTLPEALNRSAAAKANGTAHPCFTFIDTNVNSCKLPSGAEGSCDSGPAFENFAASYGRLRNNTIKAECLKMKHGFTDRGPEGNQIHISWHVRNGDRCTHCTEPEYYRQLYRRLLYSPTIAKAHHLAFDSHDRAEHVEHDVIFKAAAKFEVFHTTQSLLSTVCRFATSDVLITSGSSLVPFIAAFLPPLSPIVLEERRKEVTNASDLSEHHHFFRWHEAVLLEDGKPISDNRTVTMLLESVLKNKLVTEKQYGKRAGNATCSATGLGAGANATAAPGAGAGVNATAPGAAAGGNATGAVAANATAVNATAAAAVVKGNATVAGNATAAVNATAAGGSNATAAGAGNSTGATSPPPAGRRRRLLLGGESQRRGGWSRH